MFRFTTAVVTNAAQRTFATSATLLGSRSGTVSYYDDTQKFGLIDEIQGGQLVTHRFRKSVLRCDGNFKSVALHTAVEFDVANGNQNPTVLNVTAIGGSPLPARPAVRDATNAAIRIRTVYTNRMMAENARLQKCVSTLEGELTVANGKTAELLQSSSIDDGVRKKFTALEAERARQQHRCSKLEAVVVQYERTHSFILLGQAFHLLDEHFKIAYGTEKSLLNTWRESRVQGDKCNDAAERALTKFIALSAECIPKQAQTEFFVAWYLIRGERNTLAHPVNKLDKLEAASLTTALELSSEGRWSKELSASIIDVIFKYPRWTLD